jgi:hypothetical protein
MALLKIQESRGKPIRFITELYYILGPEGQEKIKELGKEPRKTHIGEDYTDEPRGRTKIWTQPIQNRPDKRVPAGFC